MKKIVAISTKGGRGKSRLVECSKQYLKDAQVIDLYHQKRLTLASRSSPIKEKEATANYLIYDTPPYNESSIISIMSQEDRIIIPGKIGYPDLLAVKTAYDNLDLSNSIQKSIFVFDKGKNPITNEHKEIISCFEESYSLLKKAEIKISRLDSFSSMFRNNLERKANRKTSKRVYINK